MFSGEVGERSQFGWLSAIVILSYCAILLTDVPLIDPDEGLHASIAQEMVERGEWVVPRLMGKAFYDKPILYFWGVCASLSMFGMNEFGVRLPGLIFGLMGAWACRCAAREWFGRETGRRAFLIQGTTLLPFATSQVAVHDVLLVPWTIGALISLWRVSRSASIRSDLWRPLLSASLFLGLAILTKGLIGAAFVMLAFVPAAILTGRLPIFRIAGVMMLSFFGGLLIASPWYLWMEVGSPGYLRYYFYERHIVGFLSPTKWHGSREWWYYLPIVAMGSLPWGAYLPGAAWHFRSERRVGKFVPDQAERVLLWCWLVMGVIFLSAAKSKLTSYCLPLFPAISILAADYWERNLSRNLNACGSRYLKILAGWLTLSGPVIPAAIWIAGWKTGLITGSIAGVFWSVASTAVCCAGLAAWRRGSWEGVFRWGVASFSAISISTVITLASKGGELHSGRQLADYLNEHFEPGEEWILLRERIGSVLFYLKPEVRKSLEPNEITSKSIGEFIKTFRVRENQRVVIPEREVPLILHYVEFSHLPYERDDRYRIYSGKGFEPLHVRRIPPEGGGILAN